MKEITINNKKLFLVTGDIFELQAKGVQLILTGSGGGMAFEIRQHSGERFSRPIEEYKLEDVSKEVKTMLDEASSRGYKSVGMNAARTTETGKTHYEAQGMMIEACREWLESHPESLLESIYLVDKSSTKNFETAYDDFIKID